MVLCHCQIDIYMYRTQRTAMTVGIYPLTCRRFQILAIAVSRNPCLAMALKYDMQLVCRQLFDWCSGEWDAQIVDVSQQSLPLEGAQREDSYATACWAPRSQQTSTLPGAQGSCASEQMLILWCQMGLEQQVRTYVIAQVSPGSLLGICLTLQSSQSAGDVCCWLQL